MAKSSGADARETRAERERRLAEIQGEQAARDRRRQRLTIAIAVLVSLALIIPVALVLTQEQRRQDEIEARANAPIQGVEEVTGLSSDHVVEPVDYETSPPAGGDHHPTWQNCGFYGEPVVDEHAVHSLEHGAVWLGYDPEPPEADVARLRALTQQHPYLLVSPFEGLGAPLVATAWGFRLELDGVQDDRLEPFLLRYLQGEQTPEPGAACTGGMGA